MSPRLTLLAASAGLLLAGCGVPIPFAQGSGGFPHQDDYLRAHMDDAEEDDAGCLECHGEDEEHMVEGSEAPHCSQCHSYPPEFDTAAAVTGAAATWHVSPAPKATWSAWRSG